MPARLDERNGRWRYRIVVDLPDGRTERISGSAPKTANTKRAAEQAEREHVQRVIQEARFPELARRRQCPTLAEFSEDYLRWSKRNAEDTTHALRENAFRKHLIPALGERRLYDLDTVTIEKHLLDAIDTGISSGTVNIHATALRSLLTLAVEWKHLERMPKFRALSYEPETDWLTDAEFEQLVESNTDELRTMVLVMGRTGLRRGELLGLEWEQISLETRQLIVDRQLYRDVRKTTKSGKPRPIPLLRGVAEAIAALPRRARWVFPGRGGDRPLWETSIQKRLDRATKQAKIRAITPHTLRHTFAAHLVQRGCPLAVVQELLGHATITTTMRYVHLAPATAAHWIQVLEPDDGNIMATRPNREP